MLDRDPGAERPTPLPRSPAPCWRCKGPSARQGLRYLLCPQCQGQEDQREQRTERACDIGADPVNACPSPQ